MKLNKLQSVDSTMNKYLSLMIAKGRSRPAVAGDAMATASFRAPNGVRFIPGENVLLLAVNLPKMSAAHRSKAAAFAVEDLIAQPLDEVHVALGPELATNRWLVGVVARTALPANAPAKARARLRLLPDTLALPVPATGHWTVWRQGVRVLVRLSDATGFVTNPQAFPVLHQIAGAPEITLYGGDIELEHTRATLPALTLPSRFDLAEGQRQPLRVPALARRLAAVAAFAGLGHLLILSADVVSLSRQQAALMTELRTLSDAPPDVAIDNLLTQILAPAPTAPEAGFFPLLDTTFVAIADLTGSVSLRELRYSAAEDDLTLTLQAPDLGTLQQVEADFVAARLAVTSGPATSANGTAEQQMTLQGPPG